MRLATATDIPPSSWMMSMPNMPVSRKLGFPPRKLVDFEHDGRKLARFFFVQDPDGYQIEVIQKQGRYR